MTYSTAQVSAYARVSPRQLQYWHEQGLLVPTVRHGWQHGREYTEAQAVQALIMGQFKRKGLKMSAIRGILPKLGNGFVRSHMLVWDGAKLHRLYSQEGSKLIELMDRAPRACTLVRIRRLISQGAA